MSDSLPQQQAQQHAQQPTQQHAPRLFLGEDLMLAPCSMALVDIATDLSMPVIALRGLSGVTPSAVAEAAGCSRQAVHQWFGSRTDLQRAVAGRFVARWTRWCDARTHSHGPVGLLPDCEQVVAWTRVWLALVETAHRDLPVAEVVGQGRSWERELVARSLRRDGVTDRRAVALVHALGQGLRQQLATGGAIALGWAEATSLLGVATDAVRPGAPSGALLDVKQPRAGIVFA